MSKSQYNATPRPKEVGLIETIGDAISAIKRLSGAGDVLNCFRGQASSSWIASPSLFRQTSKLISLENNIVRELVSRYPDQFLNDRTMFDRLVRMQHFGLPTRLLDVTSNPLVALYFAVNDKSIDSDGSLIVFQVPSDRQKYYDSDSISCICNLANLNHSEKEILTNTSASNISDFNKLYPTTRLFQFIQEEKPHFQQRIKKEDLFKPYYVIPKRNNSRIVAQSGAFLAFGLNWEEGESRQKSIRSFSLRIPASSKKSIRQDLNLIAINSGSMFPEIDKAPEQIIDLFR